MLMKKTVTILNAPKIAWQIEVKFGMWNWERPLNISFLNDGSSCLCLFFIVCWFISSTPVSPSIILIDLFRFHRSANTYDKTMMSHIYILKYTFKTNHRACTKACQWIPRVTQKEKVISIVAFKYRFQVIVSCNNNSCIEMIEKNVTTSKTIKLSKS